MKIDMPLKLEDIISPYEALIVDLWGVIHDGTALYPGALDTLQWLKAQEKPVVFLSNAPRLAVKARATLDELGIARDLYMEVITSGQVAHDMLEADPEWLGTHYYYLGPSKDEDILNDLTNYTRVTSLGDAQFVLNSGYEQDFQPHEEMLPMLGRLIQQHLPLLCINPDHEVIKLDGTRMLCAGTLAEAYSEIGGEVEYVGKPFDDVYDRAFNLLGTDKVLCIGDNPLTDIMGAQEMDLDSLLITGGILKNSPEPFDLEVIDPTFVLSSFTLGQ